MAIGCIVLPYMILKFWMWNFWVKAPGAFLSSLLQEPVHPIFAPRRVLREGACFTSVWHQYSSWKSPVLNMYWTL